MPYYWLFERYMDFDPHVAPFPFQYAQHWLYIPFFVPPHTLNVPARNSPQVRPAMPSPSQ